MRGRSSGPYSAHYKVLGISGPVTRVEKTISRAPDNPDKTDSATAVRVVPQGKIELGITTKEGTVERLEGTSHEDIFVADHVLAAQNTSLTAHIVSRVRLSEKDIVAARRTLTLQGGTLSASVRPNPGVALERARATQQQILGADSVESILRALSDIDSGGISREQQTNTYLKIKALVYLRPSDVGDLAKRLSIANPASSSTEMIATALATVGSPETQDALCTAIRSRSGDTRAQTALIPVLSSRSSLRHLYGDTSGRER